MIETIQQAALSASVSALISGIGVWLLQKYIETKRRESEERATQRRKERRKADLLETKRRRATGRMFFWMHYALVHGVERANGDLEKAFSDYNSAEEEQKAFEAELIAAHQDENRRVT